MINELKGKLIKNERTSVVMKRFVNISLHDNEFKTFKLDLVRISGSCSSTVLVELVTNHPNTFSINSEKDAVLSTNDGAKMMIKYGRESPAICQLCLNHGTEDLPININFTSLHKLNTALKQIFRHLVVKMQV